MKNKQENKATKPPQVTEECSFSTKQNQSVKTLNQNAAVWPAIIYISVSSCINGPHFVFEKYSQEKNLKQVS
jgi:hypothetical protein